MSEPLWRSYFRLDTRYDGTGSAWSSYDEGTLEQVERLAGEFARDRERYPRDSHPAVRIVEVREVTFWEFSPE